MIFLKSKQIVKNYSFENLEFTLLFKYAEAKGENSDNMQYLNYTLFL
jgi:hypothetical protein